MNWKSDELKVAALRLLLGGSLRRTQEYRRYLGTRWPDYAEVARAFTDRGVELSVAALRALRHAHLFPRPPDAPCLTERPGPPGPAPTPRRRTSCPRKA